MNESLLHFVWKTKRFDQNQLKTTKGQPIELLHFGHHNHNSGPDFLDARIKIGHTYWAGNVEIHVKSSDWYKHRHQEDAAYRNVILHVVYEEDQPVYRLNQQRIPTLVLKGRVQSGVLKTYHQLLKSATEIPCSALINSVDSSRINLWLDRCLIDRLEAKSLPINEKLEQLKNDWETALYHDLAKSFGQRVNTWPFLRLSESIPLAVIRRHGNRPKEVEALFFGVAGLLPENSTEPYVQQLHSTYQFLKHKYQLIELPTTIWKFSRLRPANFPTVRIAQFVQLISRTDALFSKIMATLSIEELKHLFDIKAAPFWDTHYQFGKKSKKQVKRLGQAALHSIIINTVIPMMFTFGKYTQNEVLVERAISLLSLLPPEKNHLITNWSDIGINANSAYQSQALIHLRKVFCQHYQCLNCGIGGALLQQSLAPHTENNVMKVERNAA